MCLLFNSQLWYFINDCEFYHSKIEKWTYFPQKIYKLSKANIFFSRFKGIRGEKTQIFCTKAYREAQDNLDILLDFGKKHIQTAKYNYETAKTDTDQMSILKKMVRRCDPESSYPLVMALGE